MLLQGASERMSLYIDDMRIEKVEAENSRGFDLRKDAMAYCHSGYKPGARKQALVQHMPERTFSLHDAATGQTVYQGTASPLNRGQEAGQRISCTGLQQFQYARTILPLHR
ncbi:hypothetical protein NIB75_17575 [Bacteroides uniformis]|nr:hypothetical protein [Bacteroides uniformis]